MPAIEQNESDPRKKSTCRIILVLLLLIQALLLAYLAWSTSPNRTEVGHLGAAVYSWNFGKFDVFNVNPPLVRIVAGAPIALFCKPKYDWTGYSPRPQDRCEWKLGNAFIAANDLDDIRLYVFLMRIACIPLVLLGGYFGYCFAAELYDAWSGAVFAVLWTFSPLVLGWGATICPDVAAASIGILGLYTLWRWLKNPQWGAAIIAGVCLGLMPLTKTTWIIAPVIWTLADVISRLFGKRGETVPSCKQFAAILLIALYTLNSGYFFDGSFRQLKDYKFISGTLTGIEMKKGTPVKPGNRFAESWIGYVPVPLPADFVQGIDTQKLDFERGIESYARGVWSDHGWWWYYAYVLTLKEPLAVWLLGVLAVISLCWLRSTIRDELLVLLSMLLVFAFISSQKGFSIHPRYIILVLPFLYILIARVANTQKTALTVCSSICLVWLAASSLWTYPHSMSYFNELADGPKNWPKYLLGSNIDWGQNDYALRDWYKSHPEAKPLYISYSSTIPFEKLGIKRTGEVPTEKTAGWILIGVNELFAKEKKHSWLLEYEPIEFIEIAIWVYRIDHDDGVK